MGSAAPTQQGAGGGALLQTDIRMYPFAFSLAGWCAVEFRLHYPLVPASGVPLACRRRPQPTRHRVSRGAGRAARAGRRAARAAAKADGGGAARGWDARAVRGARRACRLLSRLYFPPRGVPGCGWAARGARVSHAVTSLESAMKLFKCE